MKEVSKAIIVVEDKELGPCLLLSKEKSNGEFSLFGGGFDSSRDLESQRIPSTLNYTIALGNELIEEIGKDLTIVFSKRIFYFEKPKGKVLYHINSVEIICLLQPNGEEIIGIGLYPMSETHEKYQEYLKNNMTGHCAEAIKILFSKEDVEQLLPGQSFIVKDRNYNALIEEFKIDLASGIS